MAVAILCAMILGALLVKALHDWPLVTIMFTGACSFAWWLAPRVLAFADKRRWDLGL